MTNKEINRVSGRIFQALLPPSWAFRSQEDQEDYGVDGEIEITTDQDQATGFIFKVQLKGTASPVYDKDNQLVFSKASVERLDYYVNKIFIPIIFVVCDVNSERCYWCRVQGNRVVEEALRSAQLNGQADFTIKFPPSSFIQKNEICAAAIIEGVECSNTTLALRKIKSLHSDDLRSYIRTSANAAETEKILRRFVGLAANEEIERLLRPGNYQAAAEKSFGILESISELPESRINAGMRLISALIEIIEQRGVANLHLERASIKLGISSKMIPIVRQRACPAYARLYVKSYVRSARMCIASNHVMALVMSERAQNISGDSFVEPIVRAQRIGLSDIVIRDFVAIHRNIAGCVEHGFDLLLPYLWGDWVKGIEKYVKAVRLLGDKELANACVHAVKSILPFCLDAARGIKIEDERVAVLLDMGLTYLSLSDPSGPNYLSVRLKEFEASFDAKNPIKGSDGVLGELNRVAGNYAAPKDDGKSPSMEELKKYYLYQASALGINMDDPNDDIANIVRIGVKDLDPTRVVRSCKHIHVVQRSLGIPGRMLGLPTAGSKEVVCLRFGHSCGGLDLDQTFKMFSGEDQQFGQIGRTCVSCPEKAPHPSDWQWNEDWDRAQREIYLKQQKKPDAE